MQIDDITLKDLSIFNGQQSGSIFHLLDHTITHVGQVALRGMIRNPPQSLEALKELQAVVNYFVVHPQQFTTTITNGTMVMVEKFFEEVDAGHIPQGKISMAINGFFQKLLNKNGYFLTQFSITHVADLVKGCQEMIALKEENKNDLPALLVTELEQMSVLLHHSLTEDLLQLKSDAPYAVMARLSFRTRREMKRRILTLMEHFARLDAWFSMAKASVANHWHFPKLLPALPTQFRAKDLHHPLLANPVSYEINLSRESNFLILTGANMSGKTTFMRALGICALLAHIGCGVPATDCSISFLQGIITNMHVEDNLMMGESYFLAEVKRIKSTAEKVTEKLPHLVLMDELFKGTNVHDAYECTRAVVDGLTKHPHHLMILSTHLYEVAQHFTNHAGLHFAYFKTELSTTGNYSFSYRLAEGISNDRIGYRILQQEGVIDLLDKGKLR